MRRRPPLVVWIAVSVLGAALAGVAVTAAVRFDREGASEGDSRIRVKPEATYADRGADRLVRPVGVATVGERVFVTDAGRGEVVELDSDGEVTGAFGGGTLVTPAFIARDPRSGELVVSDRGSRQAYLFSSEGATRGVLGAASVTGGSVTTHSWEPVGVAFSEDGELVVTDFSDGHHVDVLAGEGNVRSVEATTGDEIRLAFPSAVAVKGDEIWVADSNALRIVILDMRGEFQREIPLDFVPRGIAFAPTVGRFGRVRSAALYPVVADAIGSRIVVLSENGGDALVSYGADGKLKHPNGIAVDDRGRLLVADTEAGRIRAFVLTPVPFGRGYVAGTPWWVIGVGVAGILLFVIGAAGIVLSAQKSRRADDEGRIRVPPVV